METVIVASHNLHKLREIRQILLGFTVKDLNEFPNYPTPLETGKTFLENARIKARALANYLPKPWPSILADDSGLECEDLQGAPGIFSSRFSGEKANDAENNKKLIAELKKVEHATRAARYVCAAVLILPNGKEKDVVETCEGRILLVPRGISGFGYDPLFYLEDLDKTFAELSPEEKNKISHRGKALRALSSYLSAF